MSYYDYIAENFQATIEAISHAVDPLAAPMERSCEMMTQALLGDRKIIACGNGPDGALAQLFVCNLLGGFEQERPALPALALTADAVSLTGIGALNGLKDVYSRQIRALGQSGDVLLCIASGDSHSNLIRAVQAAHERNMDVVALSNTRSGELSTLIRAEDSEMLVAAPRQNRTLELQTMIIHCLCELIERNIFGSYTQD